jgi:hypothetical protein
MLMLADSVLLQLQHRKICRRGSARRKISRLGVNRDSEQIRNVNVQPPLWDLATWVCLIQKLRETEREMEREAFDVYQSWH